MLLILLRTSAVTEVLKLDGFACGVTGAVLHWNTRKAGRPLLRFCSGDGGAFFVPYLRKMSDVPV